MEMAGQLHDLAVVSLGKQTRYSLDRKLVGPQGQSGCGNREKPSRSSKLNSDPLACCQYIHSSSRKYFYLVFSVWEQLYLGYSCYTFSRLNAVTNIILRLGTNEPSEVQSTLYHCDSILYSYG